MFAPRYIVKAAAVTIMERCLLVFQRNQKYFRIPDAEVEDWTRCARN